MPPKKKAKVTPTKSRAQKPAQQPNGTPQSSSKAPKYNAPKSPTAQPAQLSAEEHDRLRNYLETKERPFNVRTVPITKKRKRGMTSKVLQLQDDLFEERLSVFYKIEPRDKWEKLRRYKKFTVGNESIATGECILVKHDESDDPKIDIASQWKAKVLEVRALDPEHVYIRVSWLNRPEDLDSGRKEYHGQNELIPTNQMDIIDAMAVNGALPVEFWNEFDDQTSLPAEDQYFWRQTLDFAQTKTFSELRKVCIDDAPQNPEELIVSCPNGDCLKWMHVKCLGERALEHAVAEEAASSKPPRPGKTRGELKNAATKPKITPVSEANRGMTKAEVFIEGHPDRPNMEPAVADEIIITLKNGEQYSAEMRCLFCDEKMGEKKTD